MCVRWRTRKRFVVDGFAHMILTHCKLSAHNNNRDEHDVPLANWIYRKFFRDQLETV